MHDEPLMWTVTLSVIGLMIISGVLCANSYRDALSVSREFNDKMSVVGGRSSIRFVVDKEMNI